MNNSLGTLLVARLQAKGIYSDDYQTIVRAVFDSLYELNKDIRVGESVTFPNGVCYTKQTEDWV